MREKINTSITESSPLPSSSLFIALSSSSSHTNIDLWRLFSNCILLPWDVAKILVNGTSFPELSSLYGLSMQYVLMYFRAWSSPVSKQFNTAGFSVSPSAIAKLFGVARVASVQDWSAFFILGSSMWCHICISSWTILYPLIKRETACNHSWLLDLLFAVFSNPVRSSCLTFVSVGLFGISSHTYSNFLSTPRWSLFPRRQQTWPLLTNLSRHWH